MTQQKFQKGLDRAQVLVTAFGFLVALTTFISTSNVQTTASDRTTLTKYGEVLSATKDTAKDFFYPGRGLKVWIKGL